VITARHRRIALLVAGCYFMEMLDGALPAAAARRAVRNVLLHPINAR
jgi:hypothetical protein